MTLAVGLAGGKGTRIAHLHPDVPKPMIPVAGRPFLGWVLEYLARQGVTRAVVSTGHLGEVVADWLATDPVAGIAAEAVCEPSPLGTAGGFLFALAAAGGPPDDEPVLSTNGDSLVLADLAPAFALARESSGALVGLRVEETARFGSLEVDPEGRLLAFREKVPGPGLINAGIYLLAPAALARFNADEPLSFERDVFPRLLAEGADLRVHGCSAPFLDIGVPDSLARAEAFLAEHWP